MEKKNTKWLFLILVTAVNVIMATTYSLVSIISPQIMLPAGITMDDAAFIFALYAAARTIPIAIITLIALFRRSIPVILTLGILVGVIQFMDMCIGFYQESLWKTAGPLFLGILQFAAIILWLRRKNDDFYS